MCKDVTMVGHTPRARPGTSLNPVDIWSSHDGRFTQTCVWSKILHIPTYIVMALICSYYHSPNSILSVPSPSTAHHFKFYLASVLYSYPLAHVL